MPPQSQSPLFHSVCERSWKSGLHARRPPSRPLPPSNFFLINSVSSLYFCQPITSTNPWHHPWLPWGIWKCWPFSPTLSLSVFFCPPHSVPFSCPMPWASPRLEFSDAQLFYSHSGPQRSHESECQWSHLRGGITTCRASWLLPQALVQTPIWFLRFRYTSSSPHCIPFCHDNFASLLIDFL